MTDGLADPATFPVLIEQRTLQARIEELAQEIERALAPHAQRDSGEPAIVALVVLTGGLFFAADLLRRIDLPLAVEFAQAQSYPGAVTTSQGVTLVREPPASLKGRHVLLIDDVYDTGATLSLLQRRVGALSPASLRTCALLRKDAPRAAEARVDFAGFDIPDVFVVGYGLDYAGAYRNLPDVRVLPLEARRGPQPSSEGPAEASS